MLHDYLEANGLHECEVSIFFLKLKIKSTQNEKSAAWHLFVELATRITTQSLPNGSGVEERALKSIYEFFIKARTILVEQGRLAENFSLITVYTMNHVLRPFLSKWHRKHELDKCFEVESSCQEFREDLITLQKELKALAFFLADSAGVKVTIAEEILL